MERVPRYCLHNNDRQVGMTGPFHQNLAMVHFEETMCDLIGGGDVWPVLVVIVLFEFVMCGLVLGVYVRWLSVCKAIGT